MQQQHKSWVVCLVVGALSLFAVEASASGFAAARFGGELGNPVSANPASIYYNPAGLALTDGTQLMLDLSTVYRSATYDRPESAVSQETIDGAGDRSADAIASNTGEATVGNVILSPMLGVSSDLGLDSPLRVGLGFYAPFGGQAVWDEADAIDGIPGAVDGPQRWYTIDGTVRTLALSAAVAYEIEAARLSLGLSASYYRSDVSTIRGRVANGTDQVLIGGENLAEGRSRLDVSSNDFGVGAGVMWEAMEDQLWLGASWQSQANVTGDMELEGELENILGTQPNSDKSDVKMEWQLPDIYRLGARYKVNPDLELRVFADYTRWSVFESQCLAAADRAKGLDDCREDTAGVVQVFERQWEDAFGVRAGASYWATPGLEIIAGGGFDANAVPDETLDPALMDMDKFTASLGAKFQIIPNLDLMVTGTGVFYAERDTTETASNQNFDSPSKQPSNAGVYNQSIYILNTNLQFGF